MPEQLPTTSRKLQGLSRRFGLKNIKPEYHGFHPSGCTLELVYSTGVPVDLTFHFAPEIVSIQIDTTQKCDHTAGLLEELDGLLGGHYDKSTKGGVGMIRIHEKGILAA